MHKKTYTSIVAIVFCIITISTTFITGKKSYALTIEDTAELNKNLINLDFQAYGFILAQNHSVNICAEKCPQIAKELRYAEAQINMRVAQSIKRIKNKYKSKVNFPEYDKKLIANLEQTNNLSTLSCSDCQEFTRELIRRADGYIPDPIYAALIRNNPNFRNRPDLEYSEGIVREWKSATNAPKLHGISMSLKHPVSWKAKDGRGPHIVKKFTNDYGFGIATFMIQARDLSSIGIESLSKEDIKELLEYTTTNEYMNEIAKGADVISHGRVVINNHESTYFIFNQTKKNMKTNFNIQSIIYTLIADGKFIQLQGVVGVPISDSIECDTNVLFKKYERVFELMANSLYIYNQFEQSTKYNQRSSTVQ